MDITRVEETPRPGDDQGVALFHHFPLLPTELQIQIWQAAASTPRVVQMELDTAYLRSTRFTQHGQPNPNTAGDKVPPLLHANHQSRQICLAIYKNRFQIGGCNGLWETYMLADHDILALNQPGLLELATSRELNDNALRRPHTLARPERDAWRAALQAASSFPRPPDLDVFRSILTPGIKQLLESYMQPPSIPNFRGDLGSIKRLLVHKSYVEECWPGLYRDPALLANLDRAFPVVAGYTYNDQHASYAPLLAEAGVADLPERYRCRPLYCPGHVDMCDRKRPAVAVARAPLNQGQWFGSLVPLAVHLPGAADYRVFGRHDVVMWCFSQPRYHGEPLPDSADEAERAYEAYAGYLQLHVRGVPWQMVAIYDRHDLPFMGCKWLRGGDDDHDESGGEPPPSSSSHPSTLGCWVCENPPRGPI
ncbi:hypothetical protein C8A00DRAFT_11494 [Chaetomidium leptoderma]|uniref:2EXR domain-containing protein n=1 Tax=Chaetomidium leptoderma TaxID=669021 RepID=A0AAN6VTT2_9PEZI|nr:hypothetical protein C8A00DRAFT_11494 [Chaetomidium leptoderma]